MSALIVFAVPMRGFVRLASNSDENVRSLFFGSGSQNLTLLFFHQQQSVSLQRMNSVALGLLSQLQANLLELLL